MTWSQFISGYSSISLCLWEYLLHRSIQPSIISKSSICFIYSGFSCLKLCARRKCGLVDRSFKVVPQNIHTSPTEEIYSKTFQPLWKFQLIFRLNFFICFSLNDHPIHRKFQSLLQGSMIVFWNCTMTLTITLQLNITLKSQQSLNYTFLMTIISTLDWINFAQTLFFVFNFSCTITHSMLQSTKPYNVYCVYITIVFLLFWVQIYLHDFFQDIQIMNCRAINENCNVCLM